ncbi:MAG TPA: hypothetical protein VE981_22815 [Planctomycetota bacterium]|nr:hypothetical protein [Planctomycetota bacterium]
MNLIISEARILSKKFEGGIGLERQPGFRATMSVARMLVVQHLWPQQVKVAVRARRIDDR